jgi:hypothetical protein
MGVKWKEISEGVIKITRNKRGGIRLVMIKDEDILNRCKECSLNHSNNKLCREFDICYWISLPSIVSFRKYDSKDKKEK